MYGRQKRGQGQLPPAENLGGQTYNFASCPKILAGKKGEGTQRKGHRYVTNILFKGPLSGGSRGGPWGHAPPWAPKGSFDCPKSEGTLLKCSSISKYIKVFVPIPCDLKIVVRGFPRSHTVQYIHHVKASLEGCGYTKPFKS